MLGLAWILRNRCGIDGGSNGVLVAAAVVVWQSFLSKFNGGDHEVRANIIVWNLKKPSKKIKKYAFKIDDNPLFSAAAGTPLIFVTSSWLNFVAHYQSFYRHYPAKNFK